MDHYINFGTFLGDFLGWLKEKEIFFNPVPVACTRIKVQEEKISTKTLQSK